MKTIHNHIMWQATAEGTRAMFKHEKRARERFYDRLDENVNYITMQSDYFKE